MPETVPSAPEKTRGVGRTPSEEFNEALMEGVGFGYFGNAIEKDDDTKEKLDQTIKAVKTAEKIKKIRTRRTPDRSYSSESYEGYHKKFYSED